VIVDPTSPRNVKAMVQVDSGDWGWRTVGLRESEMYTNCFRRSTKNAQEQLLRKGEYTDDVLLMSTQTAAEVYQCG